MEIFPKAIKDFFAKEGGFKGGLGNPKDNLLDDDFIYLNSRESTEYRSSITKGILVYTGAAWLTNFISWGFIENKFAHQDQGLVGVGLELSLKVLVFLGAVKLGKVLSKIKKRK